MVSYINDNREVVLEHTAMEIATATQTSDATVVRAIQGAGLRGLRELKQTMERWFGTSVTSAERCARRLPRSPATSTPVLILCLKAISGCARSCRGPTTARRWLRRWHCSATRAGGIFGIGASGSSLNTPPGCSAVLALPAYVMNRTGFSLAEQLIGLQRGDVLIMMGQKSPSRRVNHPARGEAAGIPTILLTQAVDSLQPGGAGGDRRPARRDSSRMLHGTVLVCLEMIVLSVASTTPQKR